MTITKEAVLKALSTVQEPDLHQDLVTLNMVHNLEIEGNSVTFTVMLTTPACPFRAKLERDSKEAVMAVDGVNCHHGFLRVALELCAKRACWCGEHTVNVTLF